MADREAGRETIFALSSGAGAAGVAVIRISGPAASCVIESMTKRPLPEARRAVVRRLVDPGTGDVIDEAMVLWMPGPASFTGEDVAELHVHGSPAVIRRVLMVLGAMPGLRMAQAGEFTRRAFENGRMSLMEVEGLADLVRAETEAQRRQALAAARGDGRRKIEAWRERLIFILSRLEASIDFCEEEDIAEKAMTGVRPAIDELVEAWSREIETATRGLQLREGLRVVIAGPPNAGKSSLLNALARREAAIVSDIAGTTRDVIEVTMDLAGLPVILCDTAGLRKAEEVAVDPVERIGQERARKAMEAAAVVIWMTGADQLLENGRKYEERFGLETLKNRGEGPVVLNVLNKSDLIDSHPERHEILARFDLAVSARTESGLARLEARLGEILSTRYMFDEPPVITRERQRQALEQARQALGMAGEALEDGRTELAAENVRQAVVALEKTIGRVDVEDLLDSIFAEFCIGK